MQLFNPSRRIYKPDEVNFLRSCFSEAVNILDTNGQKYATVELSAAIVKLYEGGLRDLNYIAELSSLLANKQYYDRCDDFLTAANSNRITDQKPLF